MRHILAASQSERNALFSGATSDCCGQIRLLTQQRCLLIAQPARHQGPHFNLRRFAHQHFNMAEIVVEALITPQIDELLVLGANLFEQLAAGPSRILMITRRAHRQYRHLNVGQTRPPILVLVAKPAEQAVPAHAFDGQTDWLVLRAALEA